MGASSVTGVGQGSADKLSTKELSILANGPAILLAGVVECEETILASPPSGIGSVTFPKSLEGGSENYVVILTPQNTASVYLIGLLEDDDGNFSGFTYVADGEGFVMYVVANAGVRASISGQI